MPNVTFDASYLLADGGRTIDFPVGDLFNPVYAQLNSLTGSNRFPTDLENAHIQLLPNDFHETKIRILQPVLNTDIYYGYKAAQANISVKKAKEEAFKNNLVFQIKKAYYDYLKVIEHKRILDSTRILVKELVRVNSKFVKYNVATKEVVYDAKAQLDRIEAQLASVVKNIQVSRIFFNFLLNRDLESEIRIDDFQGAPREFVDQSELTDKALANRSELQAVNSGIEAQGYLIKKQKSYRVPKLSVGAEFGYQGFGYTFDDKQDYYLLSFNLSIPLFQGGRNQSNIKKATLHKEQLHADLTNLTNQIKLEVSKAYYDYQEALKVHQARLSELKNARENFKILQSGYRQNQVLLVQYNTSRNNLTRSQIAEIIARYNIKIAQANIDKTIQNSL